MSGHRPILYESGRGGWIVCECGWRSKAYRDPKAAELMWARHIAHNAHG